MRLSSFHICFLILVLLIPYYGNTMDSRYVFKRLNNEDGLTHNTINDITQEATGIIWIATKQGLNKYDSYNIHTYYQENAVGIPSNFISCLLITKNNRLFVGTDQGLVEYNRKFDNFEPITIDGQILGSITTITESSTGQILIGTATGIFSFYPNHNKVTKFVSLQNESTFSIHEMKDSDFMVTSNSGLYRINSDGVLLEYFNTQNTPTLTSNRTSCIFTDSNGNCWIGTDNNGLLIFNEEKKTFEKIPLSNKNLPESRIVRDIEEDAQGNIWIASEQGIFIINPETGANTNIQHSLEKSEYNLTDNAVYCLYRSKEDIMWIGTYFGGVNYTILSNPKGFFNIHPGDGENELRGKAVNKLFKDSKNILWIATEDGGVCTFDTKTKNIIKYYQHSEGNSLSSNNVHSICEDKNGNMWFGHFMTGVDIYNPTTGTFRNISIVPTIKYSFSENSVSFIFQDSKQQIWVGTRRGVYLYDYASEELVPFKQEVFGNNFLYDIIEDSHGYIWFCRRYGGIYRYNPKNDEVITYNKNNGLSTNKIIASIEDKTGKVWFGTIDGGVNIYDPESDSFSILNMDDGLPNNTIYGILEAANGDIWLSTNQGLSLYDFKGKTFRNYNTEDGLAQMQFNFSSYFKDDDGTFYFGHINGLTYFKPKLVSDNTYKPEVLFTDLKVSNESVPITNKGILTYPINDTKEITLSYLQKGFTIDFVAVNHFSSGNNKFYYYMEGFENEWNDMGNKTSATYTNLLPGKYTFWLKAENNDGFESANIKSLEIRIRPPFYLSIVAFILYSLLLLGLFLFYRKITIEKEKEKAALALERMEKENMRELNQQRLNFYTYISHEFKTPLSIIISSIEQLFEEVEISDKLIIKFQRLSRSAKRLSFLFNQLMDFRKIETKHAKLVLQKGDIISFIQETCMVFSPLFDQSRVNFEFRSNRDNYDYWFDPDKIEKIIANLISNALKNTPIHGQVVCDTKIFEDSTSEEQKKLKICISDTGRGISEDETNNLFTPFFVNYNRYEQKSGSGIGLTLVKSLVEYLHGNIAVKSKLGEGTKFTIELPLTYEGISNIKLENSNETISRSIDLESIADVVHKPIQIKDESAEEKEFKVLIVEDTIDLADILVEHYSKSFNVSCAQNGIEALEIVKDEEPDIIISDVMMPEMDGIKFCKSIKSDEATSHIAVILLTAKTSHEDKIEGLKAGAEAYIGKPFDLNELDLHVRNFIEIRKKLKESVVTGGVINLEKLNFQDKDKKFIEKVSKIINENLESETLSTEELAKQLGMSKTLVYLKFKKLLNMSGSDYIQSLRFKKAIELMADSNRNISEIAYEVGFSDPNYFSKVFKKVYKKTPTSYRKELLIKSSGLSKN
ncbi:two-component regulator propeller domain-containing protein [Sunxiuqinia sp. A32]|uniref:two-component regulator propeller domain-containing protein n=1 Tax=Sunxiuqinia sp. A32 TaxID=3461496 RepID=UPI004045C6BA